MSQLEVLLSAKAQEGNWVLNAEHRGQAIEIRGPVPAIMHLLYSIIFQILQAPQPSERRLDLVFDYDEDWTAWKISWPLNSPDLGLLQGDAGEAGIASQHELVQDLAEACNAKLKGFKSQDMQQLLITGFWRSLGATS